jgi:hypothetical protein
MLRAQATLTAGPNQWRFPPGAKVRAVVFARVDSPSKLNAKTFRSLADRGWSHVSIDACAAVPDPARVAAEYTPEAEACRLALGEIGIGIVVLGLVQ